MARNSLYRYYENKDHILLACVQREMEPYLRQIEALADTVPDPRARIDAWVDLQMQIAAGPCHTMIQLIGEIRDASPKLRQEVLELHEPPARVLREALQGAAPGDERDLELLAQMINSMMLAAAAHALGYSDTDSVVRELKRAVSALLDG